MSWRRVLKSVQALAAHCLLFSFTLLLVFKLDHVVSCSWWLIFFPLWTFHVVVARGRFSLPAPSVPHNRHWAPCHAVVATPLLIAFELLLCIYLESVYVYHIATVNLKIVFIPLLAFEVIILIDNFRMCKALMPGEEESISDEAIWETLPHFRVAISMVFLVAATVFTLLKLCGDVGALGWWDLFINFSIAECFAFLVCTKWSNPVIHRNSQTREVPSSSMMIRYLDWNGGLMVPPEENQHQERMCGLQDVGGHIIKIPLIGFQVLLCMHLEGTPAGARNIPLLVLFSPLFLLQGAGVLLAASKLAEKLVLLLRSEAGTGTYFTFSSRAHDCLGFLHHGSRLLGWWSIDEGSQEEQARLYYMGDASYNTFCGYPPEIVKKMPKRDLAEEVWRLQAALGEQTEITKYSQQEFERLQNVILPCFTYSFIKKGHGLNTGILLFYFLGNHLSFCF
ncbi:Transmembrane Fragile-X-F-associated protein [Salix suchowensis]|nr:Transmembrane Fragile-X-F-associated protein [Salix suchowensis]